MLNLSVANIEQHLYSGADHLHQESLDVATYRVCIPLGMFGV